MIWYLKYDTVIYFTKIIIGLCPAELIVFFPFCFFFSLIFPCWFLFRGFFPTSLRSLYLVTLKGNSSFILGFLNVRQVYVSYHQKKWKKDGRIRSFISVKFSYDSWVERKKRKKEKKRRRFSSKSKIETSSHLFCKE